MRCPKILPEGQADVRLWAFPDKWFNNVEVIVAERIGMETTTYVRNIYITSLRYQLDKWWLRLMNKGE